VGFEEEGEGVTGAWSQGPEEPEGGPMMDLELQDHMANIEKEKVCVR